MYRGGLFFGYAQSRRAMQRPDDTPTLPTSRPGRGESRANVPNPCAPIGTGLQVAASASSWLVPANEDEQPLLAQDFHQADTSLQRPVEYQSHLAEVIEKLPWIAGELPWCGRVISNECNGCLACGQRCPTGALKAEESDAGRGISFETALCTDCGLCAQVCPMDAITSYAVKEVAEVLEPRSMLVYRQHSTCHLCAHTFVPQACGDELCPVCKNEQVLQNEWLTQQLH